MFPAENENACKWDFQVCSVLFELTAQIIHRPIQKIGPQHNAHGFFVLRHNICRADGLKVSLQIGYADP